MERRRLRLASCAVCALLVPLLVGCGSSSKTSTSSSSSTPTTAATASTTTAAANPQAHAACTAIIADVPRLGSPTGLGQYGKDLLKLMPVVSGSQQTTVIQAVGHIEKVLKDISSGSSSSSSQDLGAIEADAHQIGQLCGPYLSTP
jgi:hypothetical protein